MGLQYPSNWKFAWNGCAISNEASNVFHDLAVDIADGNKNILEQFKRAYGGQGNSSSFDYATHDLLGLMRNKQENAPRFIDMFWNGMERANELDVKVPDDSVLNDILEKHHIPLRINFPDLVESTGKIVDVQIAPQQNVSIGYELHDIIGQGGFGVVYLASKTTTVSTFQFALKFLDPSPFAGDYEKAKTRFQREIAALQKIDHGSIVQIVEAGISPDNKPYLVMPLIKGRNLKDYLVGSDYRLILTTFIELLDGLKHAHENDVIHRDLKPNNILVRESDNRPIILDFGASYVLDEFTNESITTQGIGTLGYIPSEVIQNPKTRSCLHDIYSTGIMLYECISGIKPDPNNYQQLRGVFQIPDGLDDVIKRAIEGVGVRTSSADRMILELEALL